MMYCCDCGAVAPNQGMPGGMYCTCGGQSFRGTYIPAPQKFFTDQPFKWAFGRPESDPTPDQARITKLESQVALLAQQQLQVLELQNKIIERLKNQASRGD